MTTIRSLAFTMENLFTALLLLMVGHDIASSTPVVAEPWKSDSNLYELKKASIEQPLSTSISEDGKWNFLYLRPLLRATGNYLANSILKRRFAGEFFQALAYPLTWGWTSAEKAVGSIFGPESTTGLDTNSNFFTGLLDDFKAKVQLIVPGTKWCGPGSVAQHRGDLGGMTDSDNCCMHHDTCPQSIPAAETKYGLKNSGLFTRSLCSCDAAFYNCLKSADTLLSKALGITYFNTLGPQCFELISCNDPRVQCRNDQKAGLQYQWSNNPSF